MMRKSSKALTLTGWRIMGSEDTPAIKEWKRDCIS